MTESSKGGGNGGGNGTVEQAIQNRPVTLRTVVVIIAAALGLTWAVWTLVTTQTVPAPVSTMVAQAKMDLRAEQRTALDQHERSVEQQIGGLREDIKQTNDNVGKVSDKLDRLIERMPARR